MALGGWMSGLKDLLIIVGFGLAESQAVRPYLLQSGAIGIAWAMSVSAVEQAIESLVVVIADSNPYTRKLTRSMLMQAKSIYEAGDGVAALDTVRSVAPDVLIVNWELPGMDGREVVRTVRAPGVFPKPNLPIIMLSEMGRRSQVQEALRLGVHEFLIKPISPKILQQRLMNIIMHPRPMVRAGPYYIPLPRRRVEMNEWLQVV
jgi:CheY-like chemotaxis protein